jgi:hypothetical protein
VLQQLLLQVQLQAWLLQLLGLRGNLQSPCQQPPLRPEPSLLPCCSAPGPQLQSPACSPALQSRHMQQQPALPPAALPAQQSLRSWEQSGALCCSHCRLHSL